MRLWFQNMISAPLSYRGLKVAPGPGIEPGTHWWEASALRAAPSLLPAFDVCLYTNLSSERLNLKIKNINGIANLQIKTYNNLIFSLHRSKFCTYTLYETVLLKLLHKTESFPRPWCRLIVISILACKQALRMGYSEISSRIARDAREIRACNGPCTIWVLPPFPLDWSFTSRHCLTQRK